MPANVGAVRDGIKANLQAIVGLRVFDVVEGAVPLPAAVVYPESIHFDSTMGRGSDEMVFVVSLAVSATVDRAAQDKLDSYLNGTGATSIKQAMDANTTLGGIVSFARVAGMRNYGEIQVGQTKMWGADFVIEVLT